MVRYRPRSIWAKSAPQASVVTVMPAAMATHSLPVCSNMDERARVLEVMRSDRRCRPVRQSRRGAGRVVTRILRKGAGTHDEQIRHVPALQIAIDGAGPG